MNRRKGRKSSFEKILLMVTAGIGVAAAQSPERLAFEVASVKPAKSQDFRNSGIKGLPGGVLPKILRGAALVALGVAALEWQTRKKQSIAGAVERAVRRLAERDQLHPIVGIDGGELQIR